MQSFPGRWRNECNIFTVLCNVRRAHNEHKNGIRPTPMFLYRGVSEKFDRDNASQLKPKVSGPFEHVFCWDEPGFRFDSGMTWDSTTTNAVIRHQFNQEGFPTSGISTTPHLKRAIAYARGKDGCSNGFVYKIDRTLLLMHKVKEFVVSEYVRTPSIPEDDEIILVIPDAESLPEAVIVEKITIQGIDDKV